MRKKAGRPKKQPGEAKQAIFSTRISDDVRQQLQAAADANNHSLSREIEQRLRSSLRAIDCPSEKEREKLGGPENYAVLRMISVAVQGLSLGGFRPPWHEDAFKTETAAAIASLCFGLFRPRGDATPPAEYRLYGSPQAAAEAIVGGLLDEMKGLGTEPHLDTPGKKYASTFRILPAIRRDLGELYERLEARS